MGFRPKSLLQRDGEPLLARQIRLLHESGIRRAVVVLGHHAERLAPLVARIAAQWPDMDLRSAVNPQPDDGPGGSLRAGLAALPSAPDAVLVLLADQPLLEARDVRATLAAWAARADGMELVVPMHDGQPGHPLVFGAAVRDAVAQAQGGAGVREWRRAHPQRVQLLLVDHPRCTLDVDTPEDVARLAAAQGVLLSWPERDSVPN